MTQDPARLRLGRIRCLRETVTCLEEMKPLPEALCFVPKHVEYLSSGKGVALAVHTSPSSESKKLDEIKNDVAIKIQACGLDTWNDEGQWIQLTEECQQKLLGEKGSDAKKSSGWVLASGTKESSLGGPHLTVFEKKSLPGIPAVVSDVAATKWEEAVEYAYSVRIGGAAQARKDLEECCDKKSTQLLRQVPDKWSFDHDEELARFARAAKKQSVATSVLDTEAGPLKDYIQSLRASSESDEAQCLLDPSHDDDTYWESDGSSGKHWLRLQLKPDVMIRRLVVLCDEDDGNFMPQLFEVAAGNSVESLVVVRVLELERQTDEIVLLENVSTPYKFVEIRIKRCFSDGVDTRIRGLKLVPGAGQVSGLSQSMFDNADFSSYPKLDQNVPKEMLYRRALVLKRATTLFDSVVNLMVPSWQHSLQSFGSFDRIRQILVLSEVRSSLLSTFLRVSASPGSSHMPNIHMSRLLARDHSHDPSADPSCKNAMFTQMFEALKPANCGVVLDYRCSSRQDQWWECVFSNEGMIDQGGGFRESISEISEELCPSASDVPLPLKLFCRTPNQLHDSSNLYRDTYVPAPACHLYSQFTWVGQLMGACVRSKEHLILALPPFFWKQLNREPVTWEQDFATVDSAQVKMLESLVDMTEEEYGNCFNGVLTYSVPLSDGTIVSIKPGGADIPVLYADRLQYSELVKKTRMVECQKQVDAIRSGLLSSLPPAVLDLVTWQELEQSVCGDPELSVDSMRKTAHYDDDSLPESSPVVKYLWTALENFSNEDRSRFLRFVTGRRRLPAPIWICAARDCSDGDALPESATCSSTLFLPNYSSAKIAGEKIRYAIYHCVAIDTDLNPYEDDE